MAKLKILTVFSQNGGGVDLNLVVFDRTICVKGFDFDAYRKIKKSQLTILSCNCFGGMVYNLFGLPFKSSLINMYESAADFIKLLRNFSDYEKKELRFYKWSYSKLQKKDFPSFHLGDVVINMNHYNSIDEGRAKWEERILRVNHYNVLAVMFTNEKEQLKEFDELPFSKKVCFVPFESDVDSAYYLPPSVMKGMELWRAVNEIGLGRTQYYNL